MARAQAKKKLEGRAAELERACHERDAHLAELRHLRDTLQAQVRRAAGAGRRAAWPESVPLGPYRARTRLVLLTRAWSWPQGDELAGARAALLQQADQVTVLEGTLYGRTQASTPTVGV